jgi:hypothetical protein
MAWVARDNFDLYDPGYGIYGKGGGFDWTGVWGPAGALNRDFSITTSTAANGTPQSVRNNAGLNTGFRRSYTSISSSGGAVTYSFWMKNESVSPNNCYHYMFAGASARILLGFESNNIVAYNGGTPITLITGYSTSTWYYVQVEFGATANVFRCFVNTTGSTTDTYSSNCSFQANGDCDTWGFEVGAGSPIFSIDEINAVPAILNNRLAWMKG